MKLIIRTIATAIILLGLIHTYFALFCHYEGEEKLWFLGGGFAVIFAGLVNFIATERAASKFVSISVLIVNVFMTAMFIYAIPLLDGTQLYAGISLFALAIISTLLLFIKRHAMSVSKQNIQTGNMYEDDTLSDTETIPMLRIFDKDKAIEFYVNWLGFSIDWEHTFSEGKPPVYIQISKSGIVIHLTEHHGDCTPGGKVYIECKGLQAYHKELTDKRYAYNAPGLETAPWKSLCMEVVDPFGNKLLFSEAQ